MAHKWMICLLAGFAHMAFVSCDNGRNADDRLPDINDFVEGEDHSVLVAYFSEPLPAERGEYGGGIQHFPQPHAPTGLSPQVTGGGLI